MHLKLYILIYPTAFYVLDVIFYILFCIIVVVHSLSCVQLFETPWSMPEACQASLSFTISWNLLKFMSIESVMLSNLSCPLLLPSVFPSIRIVFPVNWHFASGGQGIGASASVLLMNIQGWSPLGLTGLISLQSKGLSRVFSSTTFWKHQFFGTRLTSWSKSHIHTWLLEKPSFDCTEACWKSDP